MNKISPDSLAPDSRGQTILVVDDDPGNLGTIDGFLKEHRFEVLVASNGELALKRAEYARPDLILLDVVLPGIDGFEICRRLKANEITKEIPVFFLTALADTKSKIKGFEAGGIDYITKPIQREELLARVAAHLHIQRLTRELQHANEDLEQRVKERTAELVQSNQALRQEIIEHGQAKEALKEYSERLEEMVDERTRDLQHAQEQLLSREKLAVLGKLAGSLAHELRHPLGVLSNAAYFLKLSLTNADETTCEYLEMMALEVQKSDKIISELLDFSRYQSSGTIAKAEIRIAELLAEILIEQPPPEGIRILREIDPELPPVVVNAQHLKQVLANLLLNAYQAMPDGGTLTVGSKQLSGSSAEGSHGALYTDNCVLITVQDTGCGIAPEHLARLFEPLFTTKPKSIGLGLAVCKNLIEANTGHIEVTSVQGKGSTFTITLPQHRGLKK